MPKVRKRKVLKTTVVDKFNKAQEEREGEELDFRYVCNGGDEGGCESRKGMYMGNNILAFRSHVSRNHTVSEVQ